MSASNSLCRPPVSLLPQRRASSSALAAVRVAASQHPSRWGGSAPPRLSCWDAKGGWILRALGTTSRRSSRTRWPGGTRESATGWSWSTTVSPHSGSTSPMAQPTKRWAKWRPCVRLWSTFARSSSFWTSMTLWAQRFSLGSCRPPSHRITPMTWTQWQGLPCPLTPPTKAPTTPSAPRSRNF